TRVSSYPPPIIEDIGPEDGSDSSGFTSSSESSRDMSDESGFCSNKEPSEAVRPVVCHKCSSLHCTPSKGIQKLIAAGNFQYRLSDFFGIPLHIPSAVDVRKFTVRNALLDSGAALNIISHNIFTQLPLELQQKH